MIRLNLFGGPSSGKSVLSCLLFAELKLRQQKTELVKEFAKELVYQDYDMHNLREEDRIYILAEQMRRESMLHGKIDYLITDSPVLIASYYHNNKHSIELAKSLVVEQDFHFFIERDNSLPFEKYGRAHDEEESKKIDQEMKNFLNKEGIKFIEISGNPEQKINQILKILGFNDTSMIKVTL